jgi:gamma-glutamyltranspeptidase / glutathione hydrolase
VIDYRETAPNAANRDMYLDEKGNVVPDLSIIGYKSVAVPGTVAGLELAWKRHGKLAWKDLVAPAIGLAQQGFKVDASFVACYPDYVESLSLFPETKRIFLNGGKLFKQGDIFRQPELANVLRRIQQKGASDFYEGETARLLVQDMKAHGGLITAEDLKSYKPVLRSPLKGTYRGYEFITMPPPSSGGVALTEMLNILEQQNVAQLGFHSADQIHLYVEAMKRAFADRAGLMGDPDFVKMPVDRLISKDYARELFTKINPDKATPSSMLIREGESHQQHNTTHFSIADHDGNVVANTYTMNDSWGSRITVPQAGFLLNDEMDDFTSKPGVPNLYGLLQSEANAIVPHKRPLSAMTPLIVLKDGKPFLVLGSPGGPTIINTVLQVMTNVIDFGMNLQQAVDAPRFHHQWMPDQIYFEPFGISPDTKRILESRDHKSSEKYFFDPEQYMGDVEAVLIDPDSGDFYGASDLRSGGATAGY